MDKKPHIDDVLAEAQDTINKGRRAIMAGRYHELPEIRAAMKAKFEEWGLAERIDWTEGGSE